MRDKVDKIVLNHLTATHMHLDNIYLQSLSDTVVSSQIKKLNLSQNEITHVGVFGIRSNWQNLLVLNLYQNRLGPSSCKYISNLPLLEELDLSENQVQDEGIMHISKTASKRLALLHFYQNKITSIKNLTRIFPKLQSIALGYSEAVNLLLFNQPYLQKIMVENQHENKIPREMHSIMKGLLQKKYQSAFVCAFFD